MLEHCLVERVVLVSSKFGDYAATHRAVKPQGVFIVHVTTIKEAVTSQRTAVCAYMLKREGSNSASLKLAQKIEHIDADGVFGHRLFHLPAVAKVSGAFPIDLDK